MAFLPLVSTFGDPESEQIFSLEETIESWLEVERALAVVQAELGVIPANAAAAIERALSLPKIDRERLLERTRVVGYPILPLIEQLVEDSPPDVRAFLHWGATTQDIMDTGLVLQARRGLDRVEGLLLNMGNELAGLAQATRTVLIAGRTHGQQAVPTTFGAKVAVWLDEFCRHLERLHQLRPRLLVVQLFGAAGTSAALGDLSRETRHGLAARLGLHGADVPWHAARDNIAELGFVLAALASTCGKVALEVIDLSRPELSEVREAERADGRGASSTMPQKGNPVRSEAVRGMSAQARQHVSSLLAAMQVSHERSAGEWQIEWDSIPTLFVLTCGSLGTALSVVKGLQISPDRMSANLDLDGGLLMAEALMIALAPHIGRLQAHELVASACAAARKRNLSLRDVVSTTLPDELIAALPPLDEVLRPGNYIGEAHESVDAALARWAAVNIGLVPAG
jgi:3-carboxy-cis,cis-muconate cycloisomerase